MRQLGGTAVRSEWLGVVAGVCLGTTVYAQDVDASRPAETEVQGAPAVAAREVASPPVAEGSSLSFEAHELADLPGSFGDPLRGVMLLPGVSHVVSGVAQPVVRGAAPSATRVSLDGVRLPVLGHLLVGPTVVHPGLVSRVAVHRGTSSARLGRHVGGSVELEMRPETPHVQASLDLLNVGALAQGRVAEGGPDVLVAGRFAWSPWLATTALNALSGAPAPGSTATTLVASLYDYQARVSQRLGGAEVRLLALGAGDRGGMDGGKLGVVGALGFHRVDLRARSPLGSAELEAGATLGVDRLEGEGGGSIARVSSSATERSAAARVGVTLPVAVGLMVRAGADVDVRAVDVTQTNTVIPEPVTEGPSTITSSVLQPVARVTWAGAWLEGAWHLEDWAVEPGLRVDGYTLAGGQAEAVLEPRLLVRRQLSHAVALRASAGLHHQAPAYLVDVPGAESASLRFGLQRVVQTGVGADWRGGPWAVSVDGFVNPLLRTVELSLFDADFLSLAPAELEEARVGCGLAWGAELLVRRELVDGWTGLLGYTFQQSRRTQQVVRHDSTGAEAATEEATFASALEQAHVVNAAVNVELGAGWTVGGGVHLNTGAPEAGGVSSYTQAHGTDARDGSARWVPVDRDRVGRLPAYFRVDARVAKAWSAGPVQWLASLEVLNASLAREVFRYDYKQGPDGSLQRTPAGLPPVTLPMLRVQATY